METFQDAACTVEATHEPGCILSLRIKVSPEAVQKDHKKAIKLVNKQISIPGFRKGHAPNETVMERYASYVEKEWKELVVEEAYRHALELTKIYPLDRESIQRPRIESCSLEEGALVLLSYAHYPLLPSLDFSLLTPPAPVTISVSEEEVAAQLENARERFPRWEEVPPRPVEEGDHVLLSLDALEGENQRNVCTKERFLVNTHEGAAWISRLLLGHTPPFEVEGMSENDSEEEENAIPPQKVRCTVTQIEKRILPELDDELAKKMGADSLESWRTQVRTGLEKRAEAEVHHQQALALEAELLARHPFDLPASLIEKEAQDEEGKQKPDVEAAEKRLRTYFLHQSIISQKGLSVSQEEVQAEVTRYVERNFYLFQEKVPAEIWKKLFAKAHNALLREKIYALLLKEVGIS